MSTCKDCLHYEACKGTYSSAKGDEDILYDFDGEMYAQSGCDDFKPKADYVEVVRCKECWKRYKHCFDKALDDNDYCSNGERKED